MSKLFKIVLVIAVVLDALSVYFIDFIPRYITFFIPIPLLVINYVSKVSKPNFIYLLSFVFTYLGTNFYILLDTPRNVMSYYAIAMLFYNIGLIIYNYLIFVEVSYTIKNLMQFLLLFALNLVVPIYLFYNKLRIDDFTMMLIYAANIILFFQLTYMLKQKNKELNLAFIGSCIFLFSSFCSGIYFFSPNRELRIFGAIGVLTFWATHVLMSLHVIKNSKLLQEELK